MLTYLRLDAHLHRYRFDLRTGRTTEQVMDDDNSEFPSMNQGFVGRPARYTYNMHISPEKTLLFDGLMKYDVERGTAETHWFGDGRWGSEAPFAPRPGAAPRTTATSCRTCTTSATARPRCTCSTRATWRPSPCAGCALPVRVPLGFHATWIPGGSLPGGSA